MILATPSDAMRVEEFYRLHSTPNLHSRNQEYITSMIAQEAVFIEEDTDTQQIKACHELLCLTMRADIESFLEKNVPGFVLPYQEKDVLVYCAGALRREETTGQNFLQRSIREFIIDHIGARDWRRSRQVWACQFQGTANNNKQCLRPFRIIYCFGMKDTEQEKEKAILHFFRKTLEDFVPKEKIWYLGRQVSMVPDGSGNGQMHFFTLDVPLTMHQKERTKRNRYLITETEQKRLLGTRIGFVGLSTGSVALEAFLREGIGGFLRIADPDVFEISNGNRMLHGAVDEGRSKVDLCAKRIQDVDPDINVELFPDGVSDANVERFVQDCDLIVEECDDFRVKALLRFAAKKYGIPLLMASSQNGLVDVERYDIEGPTTRPFHLNDQSILDQMVSSEMSAATKNKFLSQLYDLKTVSARFLGSGVEIGKSISSWPQLAEEVFLNAAVLSHAARRILLGDRTVISGRFSMNMNELFSPCDRVQTHEIQDLGSAGLSSYPRDPFTLSSQEQREIKELSFVAYWARSAPSGGNQQPWTTRLSIDSAESKPRLEFYFRKETTKYYGYEKNVAEGWIDIAIGTMLFNADVAAAHLGKVLHRESVLDTSPNEKYALALTLSKPSDEKAKIRVAERNRLFDSLRYRTSARSSKPINHIPSSLKEKLTMMGVIVVEEEVENNSSINNEPSSNDIHSVRNAIVDERRIRLHDLKGVFAEVGSGQFQLHPKVLGLSDEEADAIKSLSQRPDVIDFVSAEGFLRSTMLKPFQEEMSRTKVFLVLRLLCDGDDGDNNNHVNVNVEKGRLLEKVWLELTWHGYGTRPFSLSYKQLKNLQIDNAFYVFSLVEPHNLSVCSSRL